MSGHVEANPKEIMRRQIYHLIVSEHERGIMAERRLNGRSRQLYLDMPRNHASARTAFC